MSSDLLHWNENLMIDGDKKINTRLIALIVIGVVFFGSLSFVYALMYDCLNPPMWMKGPPTGFDRCWKLFVNGYLPDYSDDRERYENKQFQNIMEKKATLAFNIKLDEYRYSVDHLTVQEGYRTSQEHEFFMAEAVTTHGTRYFLMTTFESEQAMDTIDVEIFEIISDKCTRNNILNSSGCAPEYLIEAQKNLRDSEGLDANWIIGEDYCGDWCDQNELYRLGCDQPILAHLEKYSNLLDEEFNGKYAMEDIGLSDRVSVEKFNECVDLIYEQRISVELEESKTDRVRLGWTPAFEYHRVQINGTTASQICSIFKISCTENPTFDAVNRHDENYTYFHYELNNGEYFVKIDDVQICHTFENISSRQVSEFECEDIVK